MYLKLLGRNFLTQNLFFNIEAVERDDLFLKKTVNVLSAAQKSLLIMLN